MTTAATAGTDSTAPLTAGSSYGAAATNGFSFATGLLGGTNNIANDGGGFGGGGAGGFSATTMEGGGGGGWRGANATTVVNGGGLAGSSYCLSSYNNRIAFTPHSGNRYVNGAIQPLEIENGIAWFMKVVPLNTKFKIMFSNCTATGVYGPGWTLMQHTYQNIPEIWNYLYPDVWMKRQGLLGWVVPFTCSYRISVAGASGGNVIHSGFTNFGGRGAVITADYNLNIGDMLIISVGQQGGSATTYTGTTGTTCAGGGGGLSSVVLNGMNSSYMGTNNGSNGTPLALLCAGGGPGAPGGTASATNGQNASTTPTTGSATPSNFDGGNFTLSGAGLFASTGRANGWNDINSLVGGIQAASGGFGGGGRASDRTTVPAGGGGGWVGGGPGAVNNASTSTTVNGGTSYYFSGNGFVANSMTITSGSQSNHGYVYIEQL